MRSDGSFAYLPDDPRWDPTCASLVALFDQFERASPGLVPVMSLADYRDAARDLGSAAAAPPWDAWEASPLAGARDPHDAKAHAAEFAARMRVERERGHSAAVDFANRMRAERGLPPLAPKARP